MGATVTAEEPRAWKEAVTLENPSQGRPAGPMQVRAPDLTQT